MNYPTFCNLNKLGLYTIYFIDPNACTNPGACMVDDISFSIFLHNFYEYNSESNGIWLYMNRDILEISASHVFINGKL